MWAGPAVSPERADRAPEVRRGPAAPWAPVGPALPVPVSVRPGPERAGWPAPAERPASGRPDARPGYRRRDVARLSAGMRPVVHPAPPPPEREASDGSAAGLPELAGRFAERPARRVGARALRAAVPVPERRPEAAHLRAPERDAPAGPERRKAAPAARRAGRARGAGAVPRQGRRGVALPARPGRDRDRARLVPGLPVSGRGRDARRAGDRRYRAGRGARDGRGAGRPPHRPERPVRRQMAQRLPSAAWP